MRRNVRTLAMLLIAALMYRLNADSSTRGAENAKPRISTNADTIALANEQAYRESSTCCALCVRATLEEDAEHKDIRVRISNASTFVNLDGNGDKTAVVKFCTPIVCKEAMKILSAKKTTEVSSLPGESEVTESSTEITATEDRTSGDKNQTHRSSSSRIGKTLKSLNCKGNSGKTRVEREAKNQETTMNSSMESKSVDHSDTSGYGTSRMTNFRSRSFDDIENLTAASYPYEENHEIVDKNLEDAETLRILQRLLENAGKPDCSRKRTKFERSRSVPRGRSRERESEPVRSNVSFPVRVDYSGAALTVADLTRPEFVRMLTEIKEQTRNLEQHLSQMNSAMRRTSFNDAVSDASKVETGKTSRREKLENCSIATCEFRAIKRSRESSGGPDEVADYSKKIKQTKREDAASQSDFFHDNRIVASTPQRGKKIERKPTEVPRERELGLEAKKSNLTSFRSKEKNSNNRHDVGSWTQERRNESPDNYRASSRLYAPRTIDVCAETQADTAKPSKIHKLKKSAVTTSSQSKGTRPRINEVHSRHSLESEERPRSSSPPRSSGRMNRSMPNGSRAPSLIPMRAVRTKPRSAPDRSTLSRLAAECPSADLAESSQPAAPIESQRQRGRSPTRSSPHGNSSSQSPRTAGGSSPRPEARSRSNNSERTATRDSIVFRTLHDSLDASGSGARSEILEIQRTRFTPNAPNSLAFEKWKKSASHEKGNAITRRSILDESESSCTTDTWGTSRSDLPESEARNSLLRNPRKRTPETRINDRTENAGRSSNNSGPARQARKLESTRESSPAKYSTNNGRFPRVNTAKPAEDPNDKATMSAIHANDGKSKLQKRSKSDSRDSRNNDGRDSR